MTQQDVFLRSILEAPDDDLPRLAYADWLEEQGDPRGEFIHLQIDLARLPAHDPRRADMKRREEELLQRHAWEWAEPLGSRISEWVFQRGFIERVSTNLQASAADIVWLLEQAPLRCLRDVRQFTELKHVLEACPHFTHLTGLEIWGLYAFDNILLQRILLSPDLRNLRTLILHHDRNGNLADDDVLITGLASPHLANLQELAVNVDGCWRGPSNQVVQGIFRSPSLSHLRKLTLSHAELDLATVSLLARSRKLPFLEHLDLGGCRLSRAVWQAVLRLIDQRNVNSLRLTDADVVDDEGGYIGSAAELFQEAFEKRAEVDWESAYICPWGEGCWTGFSWEGRRRAALVEMDRFIRGRDYAGLEAVYRKRCAESNGEAVAREIDALPFERYAERLRPEFESALAQAAGNEGQTIIYHVRPDLDWEAKLSIEELEPTLLPGAPAVGPSLHRILGDSPGPDFPEAALIYNGYPFRGSIHPSNPALYMVARTAAAFARLISRYQTPVPVSFSCLGAIFRM